jgi:23S rRNA pseudouridine1911/1915/1917 synthase
MLRNSPTNRSSSLDRLDRIERALASSRLVVEYHQQEGCPSTLLAALLLLAPNVPVESWTARIASGAVYINGVRAVLDRPIAAPVRVEYFEPRSGSAVTWTPFTPAHVIYEDEDLLAVFKPAHLPSIPTRDQQGSNLRSYLDHYVGSPIHMPSRLDTSACGVVLTSKNPRSHRAVQHAFQFAAVQKQYVLRCRGPIPWLGLSLSNSIGRDPLHQILRAVGGPDGKPARTELHLLRNGESAFLLARPTTGRTHQLRVHTSYLGHPIDGDNFYDGAEGPVLCLLAYRLRLTHPRTQEQLSIEVPLRLLPPWCPSELLPIPLP